MALEKAELMLDLGTNHSDEPVGLFVENHGMQKEFQTLLNVIGMRKPIRVERAFRTERVIHPDDFRVVYRRYDANFDLRVSSLTRTKKAL